MRFKDFCNWCNDRWFDGKWGFTESALCVNILSEMKKAPFWKRKRLWEEYSKLAEEIVSLTNKKIEELEK